MKGLERLIYLYFCMLSVALAVTGQPGDDAPESEGIVAAEEGYNEEERRAIAAAEKQFKATFTNAKVVAVERSPISGVYQVLLNNQIIYYSPSDNLMLVGQIWDSEGRSLTDERLGLMQAERLARLDTSSALVIGKGPVVVVEFTDPDCPYCRGLEQLLRAHSERVSRHVIFTPLDRHPQAALKAEHVLCSDDPSSAMRDIYAGEKPKAMLSCKEGRERLEKHREVSRAFGISGTPTVAINGQVVTAFNKSRILELIQSEEVSFDETH